MRLLVCVLLLLGSAVPAAAGFRTPESLVRNVYAHYGQGTPELSAGLPRTPETAAEFFDPSLAKAWAAPRREPYDFLVQSPRWKLGPVAISILRRQFDKTYVAASFDNQGRRISMNFIVVKGPDGWVILDVETPHDSLKLFLEQFGK
ncbi:conserved hypothetical protein; putative secreted protein [Bradyrhizobium sp. ORS 278]|uniref:hypothetical protein n=1 Tax=Bradyrhizobium sp. (strain ORS 278) TaxID=114615 RepID=UPI0001508D9F|nr:hypothetical protein [Bradyrhizobium sp. ORS 278]CAL78363.1 conserved hypothetical protein; putative secreted protein [Bradyrhizobium sp. ORS 278]